jgi:hypothetical protein
MGLTFRLGQLPTSLFTDASNNVGIGAAPSGSYKLEVTGTAKVSSTLLLGGALTGTSATFSSSVTSSLNGFNACGAYGITSYEGSSPSGKNIQFSLAIFNSIDAIYQSSGNTNDFGIWTNGGTSSQPKLYIKNAGNVGIGTSSPVDLLTLNVTSASTVLQFQNGGVSKALLGVSFTASDLINNSAAGDLNIRCTNSQNINFSTNNGGTLAMRITSTGTVLIGIVGNGDPSTATLRAGLISGQANTSGNEVLAGWNQATTGDNKFIRFYTEANGSERGSIDYNRAAGLVRYNVTSDKNLKNIIGDSDVKKSIDILNSTRIREYSWKEDDSNKSQIGVIAQELYETYKGAVSVGSDEELLGTEDYKPWGVDKTAFTFHLIAGWQKHEQMIQEQQAQIEELKAMIAAK